MKKYDLWGNTQTSRAIGSHHSSAMKKDEWLTPPHIIEMLGPFDLDPCSPIVRPWPTAKTYYTVEDNGLKKEWFGNVWLNPPYGRFASSWLEKLAHHGSGIALIFARTETKFFVDQVWNKANALLFVYGRLHFYHVDGRRAKGNSGAPSVLVAYGPWAVDRLRNSEINGKLVEINQ